MARYDQPPVIPSAVCTELCLQDASGDTNSCPQSVATCPRRPGNARPSPYHQLTLARSAARIYAMADSVDVLITGGTVYDGTGAAGRRADVAVRGDRIVEMGDLPDAQAPRVVDATGLAVTPGFINTHTHSDMACFLGD